MRALLISVFFLLCLAATAQEQRIRIRASGDGAPVPFAAIRLGASGQGVIADIDGQVVLPATWAADYLEISALGFEPKKIQGRPAEEVFLKRKAEALRETVVRPDYDKLRSIIRTTIARRDEHNPERYPWYRCNVYYKMTADASLVVDTARRTDTTAEAREIIDFFNGQHLLMTETYSRRTFKRPQKLQEEVMATRFSGFKSPLFTALVTDMLPFHCYTDYLKLNGRDFRNPLSPGSGQWFGFNLRDELMQGLDTLWIISFFPTKVGEALRGRLYINSKNYAVTAFIGEYRDTVLGSSIRMEQRYQEIEGRMFPHELNYVYRISQGSDGGKALISMQGVSRIDSVSFAEDRAFRFDKVHTVKLEPTASKVSDSAWALLRPEALNAREARTYVFMDSIMESVKAERFVPVLAKLIDAKVALGPVDINIDRLYRFNNWEGSRLGLGLQTGDRISQHLSVGAWAGYGTRDVRWKWGGFLEANLDRYKETVLRLSYEHDIRDPGRVQLHPELDRAWLRNLLILRADAVDVYALQLQRRFGYFSTELGLRYEEVTPLYPYQWNWEGQSATSFTTSETSLRLRYAFAERRAPLFSKYYPVGSDYPVVYARTVLGRLTAGNRDIDYLQLLAGLSWKKHIAGIGQEAWFVQGGKIWSDAPLPLSKLYAAPGVRTDDNFVYIFGGLQTLRPYTYYSDAFVFGSWRHDFDWRFYRADFGELGSMPGLSLMYNGFWGTLSNRAAHATFDFKTAEAGYHEAGAMLRDIIRAQYLNLYYIGLTAGYFYPLQPARRDAGVYVLGLSVTF